jgi:hypothetical protein
MSSRAACGKMRSPVSRTSCTHPKDWERRKPSRALSIARLDTMGTNILTADVNLIPRGVRRGKTGAPVSSFAARIGRGRQPISSEVVAAGPSDALSVLTTGRHAQPVRACRGPRAESALRSVSCGGG